MTIRDATRHDARALARLVRLAGDGIPEMLWREMAHPGESVIDVGARRAARGDGAFSYTRARVCEERGAVLGMLIGYRQPDPYPAIDLAAAPDILHPLLHLESRAPGSWYINALAVFDAHRGRGVGRRLLDDAHRRAADLGCDTGSLIVASTNPDAERLYLRMGYRGVATAPMTASHDRRGTWKLMTRPLPAPAG